MCQVWFSSTFSYFDLCDDHKSIKTLHLTMLISKIIYAIDALTDYYFKKRVFYTSIHYKYNENWWKVVCIRHTDTNQNSQFKHIRFCFFFGIKSKQWFNPETPKYSNKQNSGKHWTIWHEVTEAMNHGPWCTDYRYHRFELLKGKVLFLAFRKDVVVCKSFFLNFHHRIFIFNRNQFQFLHRSYGIKRPSIG